MQLIQQISKVLAHLQRQLTKLFNPIIKGGRNIAFFKVYTIMKKTIILNGKEYIIKYTIRALFIFEQITGKPFEVATLLDSYILMYSMLLANNDDCLSWDDFLNCVDENPNLLNEMEDVTKSQNEKLFANESDDKEKKKV